MARDTKNKEGLTFEEWVCAAGVAAFDMYGVRPYTSSNTTYIPLEVGMDRGGAFIHRGYFFKRRTRTSTFYPKKIRQAWKNNEDPTEYKHVRVSCTGS